MDDNGIPVYHNPVASAHSCGGEVVAEAGGFRLLRAPAWLWHGRPVTLVDSAERLAAWQPETEANL